MQFFRKYFILYLLVAALMIGASMLASDHFQTEPVVASTALCRTLIIDAGHGGEDGGAVSCTGVRESELNLQISLRLRDFCDLIGIPVIMIRTTDEAVYSAGCKTIAEKKVSDLKNRVALVNATPDALLLSIHQNTFSDSKYSGAQVFYADGGDSQTLAEQLQATLNSAVDPGNHREAKSASAVYLMKNIRCTGVLVECGFLSNADEEARLQTDDYQKRLICAIGACVSTMITKETKGNEF